jgi:hypothetical protein
MRSGNPGGLHGSLHRSRRMPGGPILIGQPATAMARTGFMVVFIERVPDDLVDERVDIVGGHDGRPPVRKGFSSAPAMGSADSRPRR